MPTASELTINNAATADQLVAEIFGEGVTLVAGTASYSGDAVSSGIYSGAISTLEGISPTDTGVILSTGNVADFTNTTGDANTAAGTSTDVTGGIDGDADLNSVAGQATFDGAILETDFIPVGDTMTIQLVFSSEEYLEYVNGGVNDSLGLFVNGVKVDFVLGAGNISIDEITNTSNSNLYLDNPAGTNNYNTEMDGLTKVLTFKADVNPGVVNTFKLGIADGGDAAYDSNVLVMANSVQSTVIAGNDTFDIPPNTSALLDPLANDQDLLNGGLTITQVNGDDIAIGETVILGTGEQITLNDDNTFTVLSDSDVGSSAFTYTVTNNLGTTDIGIIELNTVATPTLDGIVEGTAGADTIDSTYVGDPDGDRVDNSDAITPGHGAQDDVIYGFGGNDSVVAGSGNDTVLGGSGDDTILGGTGNDSLDGGIGSDSILGGDGLDTLVGGAGNDTLSGGGDADEIYATEGDNVLAGDAGNDSIYAGSGNDAIDGGADNDTIIAGAGDDTILGGAGNDSMEGGDGKDTFDLTDLSGNDTIIGGEIADTTPTNSGDKLDAHNNVDNLNIVFSGDEAGTVTEGANSVTFSEIEHILGGQGSDTLDASLSNVGQILDGGEGADTIVSGGGDDIIAMGQTQDFLNTDGDNDTLILNDGFGADSVEGFETPTDLGGGNYSGNDQFDVSGLTDLSGDPVNTDDVVVSDTNGDGTGDAILTFPNGESVTLQGVASSDVSSSSQLAAMGVPLAPTVSTFYDAIEIDAVPTGATTLTSGDEMNQIVEPITVTSASQTEIAAGDTMEIGGTTYTISSVTDYEAELNNYDGGGVTETVTGHMFELDDGAGGTLSLMMFNGGFADKPDISSADINFVAPSAIPALLTDYSTDENVTLITPDYVVEGDGTANTIDSSYIGDPEGDRIDNSDALNGSNDDVVVAGGGNDTVLAGLGSDSVDGGTGDDSLSGELGNDTLIGGDGLDTLIGADGDDSLSGGNDADSLDGGTGDDTLEGDAGNDTLIGDIGADSLVGGAGADSLSGGQDVDTLVGGDGNDTLSGGRSADLLYGDVGDDVLQGDEFNDTLYGGTGNDTLDGGIEDDSLFGEAGTDSLLGGLGVDYLDGGAESDTLSGGEGSDTLVGGTGADSVDGDGGDDTFVVTDGFGADTITGGETSEIAGDTLDLSGTTTGLTVDLTDLDPEAGTFSDGTDTASFTEIENITLGSGNDTITLADGSGDDTVNNFEGPVDTGGGTYAGQDQLDVSALNNLSGNPVTTSDVTVTDDGTGNAVLTFPNGESITLFGLPAGDVQGNPAALNAIGIPLADGVVSGSSGADVINDAYVLDPEGDRVDAGDNIDGSGNDNDTIQAGDGADTIDSGAGDDTVFAGSGDDVIFLDGGIDNDSIVGGETGEIGTGDRIEMGAITDDLTIDMSGPEAGTITDGVNTTSFEDIEQLTLGAGADSLTGSTGAEYVFGGTGDDTILGGGGDDTIFSGLDDDSVEGGAGDDSIAGSTGSDTIDGGAGNDNIDVGGADSVVDTVVLQDGSGDDVVSNFEGPISNPDGSFTGVDQFDVTALNDNLGNPVNTNDVVVSDDGTGNAVLTFPNGESVILTGIAPADVTDPLALNAMGIPLGTDGIVSGTAAGELIDTGYVGDPDGDLVDANDAQFAGQTGDQDIIQAGGGNDTVIAGADDDSVLGEAGDDSLFGGDGEDTLDGGAGDDTLVGGASHDSLIGGAGNDSLLGGQSNDTLEGGAGNDTLSGGTALDSIDGGADADLIIVENGYLNDTIAGGESVTTGVDQDTIEAGSLTGDTTVIYSGDEAGDMATGANTATFTGIEEIHLGAGNDSVDAAADGVGVNVWTGAGDDTVLGGTGDDTILGQGDDDSIDGGAGNDALDGDAGNDTVLGGAGNDTLIGDLGNDSVDGGIGDDLLFGNEGSDTLTGGEGADQLFGGADADVLNVGSNDTAYGQDGDDVFNLSPADLNGGDLTIVGGELDETVGDTLNIQGPADIVYDVPGGESGTITYYDTGEVVTFSEIENINYVPCFTPGTLIKTRLGAVAVEDLETGDRVLTRDNGYRAIRWAGKRHLSASDIAQKPSLAPILIRAGALGPNLPEVDMMVSPQHRVLISTLNTQLLFGEDEVLIMAHDLLTLDGVEQAIPEDGVTYIHFMFDSHELVLSDGIWTESFQPGDLSLGSMDHERREEIFAIFPELEVHSTTEQFQAARLSLKSYQAQVVLQLP